MLKATSFQLSQFNKKKLIPIFETSSPETSEGARIKVKG